MYEGSLGLCEKEHGQGVGIIMVIQKVAQEYELQVFIVCYPVEVRAHGPPYVEGEFRKAEGEKDGPKDQLPLFPGQGRKLLLDPENETEETMDGPFLAGEFILEGADRRFRTMGEGKT